MGTISPIIRLSAPISSPFGGPFRGTARWPVGIVRMAIETMLVWADRSRQRRELASMDERALKDIGLTRIDALRESSKPFWHL